MSALPPIADIRQRDLYLRSVPIATFSLSHRLKPLQPFVTRGFDRLVLSSGMMSLLGTRRLLSAIAILGLLVSPLAKPATVMGAVADSMTAVDYAASAVDISAAAGVMPCCPEKAPGKPDCAKTCPLMAFCMAKTMQNFSVGSALLIQFTVTSIVFPGDERNLDSLFQSPPARPPKT